MADLQTPTPPTGFVPIPPEPNSPLDFLLRTKDEAITALTHAAGRMTPDELKHADLGSMSQSMVKKPSPRADVTPEGTPTIPKPSLNMQEVTSPSSVTHDIGTGLVSGAKALPKRNPLGDPASGGDYGVGFENMSAVPSVKELSAAVPALALSAMPSGMHEEMANAHATNGGATFETKTGQNLFGKHGYAVSLFPERSRILDHEPTAQDFADMHLHNQDLLSHQNAALGSWHDTSTGQHYLDVVGITPNRQSAIEHGQAFNQKSIFDLGRGEEIPTGGDGTPVPGLPPEKVRLDSLMKDVPQKTPFSGEHYSAQPIKSDMLEGARRGAPGKTGIATGAESDRLSLGRGAPPGSYVYQSGTRAEPQIAARPNRYPVTGSKAILDINGGNAPVWKSAFDSAVQNEVTQGTPIPEAQAIATNEAEHAVREAGYDGYKNTKSPQPGTVFLFGDTPLSARPLQPRAQSRASLPQTPTEVTAGERTGRGANPTPEPTASRLQRSEVEDFLAQQNAAAQRNAQVKQAKATQQQAIANQEGITVAPLASDESTPFGAEVPIGRAQLGSPTKVGVGVQGKAGAETLAEPMSKLTPLEQSQVVGKAKNPQDKIDALKNNLDQILSNTDMETFAAATRAGAVGRKWYHEGEAAFKTLAAQAPEFFSEPGDGDRFAAVVGATSPHQPVRENLKEALTFWSSWVKGDKQRAVPPRSTDPRQIEKLANKFLTLPGAKAGNLVSAFSGEDMAATMRPDRGQAPSETRTQNFKAPNFVSNLQGNPNAVTLDTHMADFLGVTTRSITKPEMYHAAVAAIRHSSEQLGMEPREQQAAQWVTTRFLKDIAGQKNADIDEAMKNLDPEALREYSESFADLMQHDEEVRGLMRDKLGVDLDEFDRNLASKLPKAEPAGKLTDVDRQRLASVARRFREGPKEVTGDASFAPEMFTKAVNSRKPKK